MLFGRSCASDVASVRDMRLRGRRHVGQRADRRRLGRRPLLAGGRAAGGAAEAPVAGRRSAFGGAPGVGGRRRRRCMSWPGPASPARS